MLRLVQEDARPYDAHGNPLPAGEAAAADRHRVHARDPSGQDPSSGSSIPASVTAPRGTTSLEGITEGWQAELGASALPAPHLRQGSSRRARVAHRHDATRCRHGPGCSGPVASGDARRSHRGARRTRSLLPAASDSPARSSFICRARRWRARCGSSTTAGSACTWRDGRGNTGVWAWLATYDRGRSTGARVQGPIAGRAGKRFFPEKLTRERGHRELEARRRSGLTLVFDRSGGESLGRLHCVRTSGSRCTIRIAPPTATMSSAITATT